MGAYGTGLILPSAYGTGALIAQYKVESLWIGMAAGIALATLGALAIGALYLRRRGIYFSMLTLAFSQLLYFVVFQARSLTGGHSGLRGIPAFKIGVGTAVISLQDPVNFYYFAFAWVLLCVLPCGACWPRHSGRLAARSATTRLAPPPAATMSAP